MKDSLKRESIPRLLDIAKRHFNLFIRLRDTDENGVGYCISSGKILIVPSTNAHAGHFYPSTVSNLRFNEDNVHLQSKGDNYFKHSNALEYRKNLIKKIGQERVDRLDFLADYYKKHGHKWDRFTLIDVIETYKEKVKLLKKQKNEIRQKRINTIDSVHGNGGSNDVNE